jgi:hypothetical protein
MLHRMSSLCKLILVNWTAYARGNTWPRGTAPDAMLS